MMTLNLFTSVNHYCDFHVNCLEVFVINFLLCIIQERSKQERANLDIVWQLENKNKEIQTLNARVQKVCLVMPVHGIVQEIQHLSLIGSDILPLVRKVRIWLAVL